MTHLVLTGSISNETVVPAIDCVNGSSELGGDAGSLLSPDRIGGGTCDVSPTDSEDEAQPATLSQVTSVVIMATDRRDIEPRLALRSVRLPRAMTAIPRFILTSFLMLGLLASVCGCSIGRDDLSRYEYTQIIMGVEARIVVYSENASSGNRAAKAAFGRMNDLDAVLSDYRRDSELMRVCQASGGPPIRVSDDLFRILVQADQIAKLSSGAFDPTVGPIVQLWRAARRTGERPSEASTAEAMSRVGWNKVTLDSQDRTVQLAVPNMQLDLGGIGKGFAVDEAIAVLAESGVTHCLIDLGGDIAAGEPPPGKRTWTIVVATDPARTDLTRVPLRGNGIATSADTEQFVQIGEDRFSHIIDPRKGLPLIRRVAVTVIAHDAATADALASALSVLEPDQGLALLEWFPHSWARIVLQAGQARRIVQSPGFPSTIDAEVR